MRCSGANEAEDDQALDLAPFIGEPSCLRVLAALYNQGSLIPRQSEDERPTDEFLR